ncbi:hypothetical protein GEMRC1_001012 [Eukaryota sp. GEM-RC1]
MDAKELDKYKSMMQGLDGIDTKCERNLHLCDERVKTMILNAEIIQTFGVFYLMHVQYVINKITGCLQLDMPYKANGTMSTFVLPTKYTKTVERLMNNTSANDIVNDLYILNLDGYGPYKSLPIEMRKLVSEHIKSSFISVSDVKRQLMSKIRESKVGIDIDDCVRQFRQFFYYQGKLTDETFKTKVNEIEVKMNNQITTLNNNHVYVRTFTVQDYNAVFTKIGQ